MQPFEQVNQISCSAIMWKWIHSAANSEESQDPLEFRHSVARKESGGHDPFNPAQYSGKLPTLHFHVVFNFWWGHIFSLSWKECEKQLIDFNFC